MLEIKSDNAAFFDVDDTLLLYSWPTERDGEVIYVGIQGTKFSAKVVPHKEHIERLKLHKAWGNGVVVWSRSGWEWAKAAVIALGLEEYVDAVSSKPCYYYDDKKCCEFLKEHRYLTPNS